MRRLETNEEKEKKTRRRNRIFSIFMLIIMLLSTAGYAFLTFEKDSSANSDNPNSQLQTSDGRFIVNLQNQQIPLSMSKDSVSNISVNTFLTLANFAEASVYLAAADNNTLIPYELAQTLSVFSGKVSPACFGPCIDNLPEKNCTDFLIVYNSTNENKVYQSDNCIFIEGDVRAVDAFLYSILEGQSQ